MPNIKSAKKRVLTNAKKAITNNIVTSTMKTAIKKTVKAVKGSDKKAAEDNLKVAVKRIDKATSKGLVHKNKAARQKSRLMKMKNTMEAK